jgi:DNA polymerase-4
MFERAILHLDLDAFFVSVERLHNTALQGKPLIIGGSQGRGVVASCSYEARAFGIHAGMPVKMALRLCPDALVLRGDMENYSRHSRLITGIIEEEAPLFEKASIDEFYLDLTGMDRHFGCWQWSKELRRRILRESGLPLSLGLSVNKLVSKVGAGEGKPNGARLVEAGTEKDFLAPLPIRKLPGVGQVTCERLRHMGVQTVSTLRRIPPGLLQRAFGNHGRTLWQKANAIDHSPVVPYRDRKSISTEHTFQTDTIDTRFLRDQLTGMATRLAFELRQKQRLTACVTVKIRYTDFNTFTRQRRIPYTAGDQALIRHAHELFDQLYQRRQLVRLVGLRFSELVTGRPQMSLFEDTGEDERLLAAMDRIRKRFGEKGVIRAAALT